MKKIVRAVASICQL